MASGGLATLEKRLEAFARRAVGQPPRR